MRRTAEQRQLTELARSLGFELVRCRRHQVWRHPNGSQVVFSATPSCPRALLNARAQLRRAASSA